MFDKLIEIDLKVFNESLSKVMRNINKFSKNIDKMIGKLTFEAGEIIINEARNNHAFKSISGTLVRSLHTAPSGVSHDGDIEEAKTSSLENSKGQKAEIENNEVSVELGSWIDYAYYVEVGHGKTSAYPYILPAFESKFEEAIEHVTKGLQAIMESEI